MQSLDLVMKLPTTLRDPDLDAKCWFVSGQVDFPICPCRSGLVFDGVSVCYTYHSVELCLCPGVFIPYC